MLELLTGISPWWWVAFAFALGALEMATMSFFLIWPALAALLMAALLAASPGMSGEVQLLTFAVLSVILTVIGRYLVSRYGDGGEEESPTLNKRGAHFVGKTGKVLDFSNGEGVIELEGMRWRARWPEGQTNEAGHSVRVVKAEGMVLDVESV